MHRIWDQLTLLAPDSGGEVSPYNVEDPEGDEPDESEVVVMGPGEEDTEDESEEQGSEEPEKISLTPEEYQKLQNQGDSAQAIQQGISQLAETLKSQGNQAPANMQQQPQESDEEFEKRISEQLFEDGKSTKAIKEALDRYQGPMQAQMMQFMRDQRRELLQLRDDTKPIFDKYGKEIDEKIKSLPPQQKNNPSVYDWAVDQVKREHEDDIVQDKVQQQVRETLKQYGFDPETMQPQGQGQGTQQTRQRGGQYHEAGGQPGTARSKGRGKIKITQAQYRDALRNGMVHNGRPTDDYLRSIGKL